MTELHLAAALTTFERPVGKVQSYVVTCSCGWESQHTRNWTRSLSLHWLREQTTANADPIALEDSTAGGAE